MTKSGKKPGRPFGWRKANPKQRERRQISAFSDEWELIKEFTYFVRKVGVEKARVSLDKILTGESDDRSIR